MPRNVTLNDCRFCGSSDVWFVERPGNATGPDWTAIGCRCGARGPAMGGVDDAAAAWNHGVHTVKTPGYFGQSSKIVPNDPALADSGKIVFTRDERKERVEAPEGWSREPPA